MGYVTSAAQMPRIAELAMQAAILERGVGMIILPGDVSAAPIEHPMLEHPITTRDHACGLPIEIWTALRI